MRFVKFAESFIAENSLKLFRKRIKLTRICDALNFWISARHASSIDLKRSSETAQFSKHRYLVDDCDVRYHFASFGILISLEISLREAKALWIVVISK